MNSNLIKYRKHNYNFKNLFNKLKNNKLIWNNIM